MVTGKGAKNKGKMSERPERDRVESFEAQLNTVMSEEFRNMVAKDRLTELTMRCGEISNPRHRTKGERKNCVQTLTQSDQSNKPICVHTS